LSKGARSGSVAGELDLGLMVKDLRIALDVARATPKGAPILGATPYPNLVLDCGQGALGFSLALGCGRVVSDLIAGKAPEAPLDGMQRGGV